MSRLRKYIKEEVEKMWIENQYDSEQAADRILEKMLDPEHTLPKKTVKKSITKVDSYAQFMKEYSVPTYRNIIQTMMAHGEPLSRKEISTLTGLTINCVCGRVAELIEAGAIRYAGYGWDEKTKRKVELLDCAFKS